MVFFSPLSFFTVSWFYCRRESWDEKVGDKTAQIPPQAKYMKDKRWESDGNHTFGLQPYNEITESQLGLE